VAQALREADPHIELLFVGSEHGPERDLAAEAGIAFESVPSSALTRSTRVAAIGRLASGVFRARRILNKFRPDVVFATGGHAAAAVVIAQRTRGGRIVIHEQNAVPGRTNLWLSRFAEKVCVALECSASYFPKGKVVAAGMPIRREFSSLPGKAEARRALGLREDMFTLVIVGGSQGARKVNQIVVEAWPGIRDGRTQVLHQVGRVNAEAMRVHAADDYHVEPTVDMPLALASADLVISRSGASTLAEITAAGVPSVLVPYPFAFADHQRLNAEELGSAGAAVVRIENDLTADVLADTIIELRAQPDRLNAMSAAARSLARPNAAAKVAEVVLGTI
jgi:UDP-N-acetylglucosamine--N-acetylmuramyl-(pentapeptide) pyrophosphoryl-undecaprenol N-acetylglucosamine transferase